MLHLVDPDDDVGAMLLRGLLLDVDERVGDGVATTSVMFQSIFDDGLRAIAAGCSATRVRRHLHDGMQTVLDCLDRQTLAVDEARRLHHVARTVCFDEALARELGEVFLVIGEHGQLELRSGRTDGFAHEILEGSYWESRLHSKHLLSDQPDRRVEFLRPLIFVSDLDIQTSRDLVPLLQHARQANADSVVVIARQLAETCITFLAANSDPSFRAIGVRLPGTTQDQQQSALDDLEVLTGGRAFRVAAGDSAARVQLRELGRSRRFWADRTHFGIIGPGGDSCEWLAHVRELRRAERACDASETRTQLGHRIARLTGASAVLWVSGATVPQMEGRKEVAKRTAAALRSALRDGVLPGAGVGLLACRAQVDDRLKAAGDADERAAYAALLRALEVPLRALAANSGHDPASVLGAVDAAPAGHGWDIHTEHVVDVVEAGILDPAAAIAMAFRTAVEGASQALTIDALVHPPNPREATRP